MSPHKHEDLHQVGLLLLLLLKFGIPLNGRLHSKGGMDNVGQLDVKTTPCLAQN